jgi:hypothetical protein
MRQFRQGDVLVQSTTENIEGEEVARENGKIVLAHGEATGHCHAIASPSAKLFQGSGKRFLSVAKTVTLEHQEHDKITIPPGNYEVIRQREYSPEAIRNVAD